MFVSKKAHMLHHVLAQLYSKLFYKVTRFKDHKFQSGDVPFCWSLLGISATWTLTESWKSCREPPGVVWCWWRCSKTSDHEVMGWACGIQPWLVDEQNIRFAGVGQLYGIHLLQGQHLSIWVTMCLKFILRKELKELIGVIWNLQGPGMRKKICSNQS